MTANAAEPAWTCMTKDGETCGTRHTKLSAAEKCCATANKKGGAFEPQPAPIVMCAGADTLIAELIAEKISEILPERAETYSSRAMEWGKQTEEEARRFYCMEQNVTTTNGGFCTTDDGLLGASPDSLVNGDGCLELKCPQPKTHVQYLLDNVLPAEYVPQCHAHLIVTGRKYCDFMSYAIGFPPLLIRVERSDYTDKLEAVVRGQFLPRRAELEAKIKERMS
jgi:predicted phage-related endonuclease